MTALPGSGSFAMVDPTHVAAVGPAAAILFARIEWRARETGEWSATRRVLMQETGLTETMLRTAITVLREREWVDARRTSTEDATLIWSPIYAGQGHVAESTTPPSGIHHTPPSESPISSYETGKTIGANDDEPGSLFLVPQPEPAVKKPARKATRLPADFRPKQTHWDLAAALGVDLTHEGPQFADHHNARGSTFKDWDAALRTWIRNAAKFAAERVGRDVPPSQWGTGAAPAPAPRPAGYVAGWG